MISNIFARKTAQSKALEELAEAEVGLLTAQTNAEYWDSQVAYNQSRVERLKEFLGVERQYAGDASNYIGEGLEAAR